MTARALAVPKSEVGRGSPIRLRVVADADAVIRCFAETMLSEFRAAKATGRPKVVFVLPVGPVGQFERFADLCNAAGESLADLVAINMDDYLTPDGRVLLPLTDPLSFRRHMRDKFYGRLKPALAPPEAQRIFPDPADPADVQRAIDRYGGVDVCFGGVGITGHIAFNDPPEPGEPMSADAFAELPTRIVRLSRETVLINAINACRGNIDRMPKLAITVGMREILASRKVRLYVHRPYQCAVVRRMLHGPVIAAVPASLLQRHPDVEVAVADAVTDPPEPNGG
jgi:glucosamine-6-phosphate deaminase